MSTTHFANWDPSKRMRKVPNRPTQRSLEDQRSVRSQATNGSGTRSMSDRSSTNIMPLTPTSESDNKDIFVSQDSGDPRQSYWDPGPKDQELGLSPLDCIDPGPLAKQNIGPSDANLTRRTQSWGDNNKGNYFSSPPSGSNFLARHSINENSSKVSAVHTNQSANSRTLRRSVQNIFIGSAVSPGSEAGARSTDSTSFEFSHRDIPKRMDNGYSPNTTSTSPGYQDELRLWYDRSIEIQEIRFSISNTPLIRRHTEAQYPPTRQPSLRDFASYPQVEPFECQVKIWETSRNRLDSLKTLTKAMTFDTGCQGGNWVRQDVISELDATPEPLPEEVAFTDFNGGEMIASNRVNISFQEDGEDHFTAWFFIADRDAPFSIVLGGNDCWALQIIPRPNLRRNSDQPRRAWGLVARIMNRADREKCTANIAKEKALHEKHEEERREREAQIKQEIRENNERERGERCAQLNRTGFDYSRRR